MNVLIKIANFFRPRPHAAYVDVWCSRCSRILRVGWKYDSSKDQGQCSYCGDMSVGWGIERARDEACPRRGKNESEIVCIVEPIESKDLRKTYKNRSQCQQCGNIQDVHSTEGICNICDSSNMKLQDDHT